MAKITSIDRAVARILAAQIEEVVRGFVDEQGLAVKYGGGAIAADGNSITLRYEVAIKNAEGIAETRERNDYKNLCTFFHLKPEWLDQEFTATGTVYNVSGLSQKSRKFPVLATRGDGKVFKFTALTIVNAFRAKEVK
jgi:hypothetical protein